MKHHLIYILIILYNAFLFACAQSCSADKNCDESSHNFLVSSRRYLLYDVNPPEGFNLRRDVYMRVAQLAKHLSKDSQDDNEEWILVLPPWGPLYHWNQSASSIQFPWSHFFNLPSMAKYTPIMEFTDFLEEYGSDLDVIYYLQYPAIDNPSEWDDTVQVDNCSQPPPYFHMGEDGRYYGHFWGYPDVSASHLRCVTVLASSTALSSLLKPNKEERAVMIDRAETLLHPHYGDVEFWKVRKSMKFAKSLIEVGDWFRKMYLNSTDEEDDTIGYWQESHDPEQPHALGGPFLGVHLRRRDYVSARPQEVPSIPHAAKQILAKQTKLGLPRVFVATDASQEEFEELKSFIPSAIRFVPSPEQVDIFGDGGVAIIDQWICSHARYFIGSFESTFSFRIMEEREILNLPPDTTFNRLCGDGTSTCEQPTQWRIQHPT